MSRAITLSIILPCLNEAAGIVAALEALQPLRPEGVEIIVVDGGSSDSTVALAAPLADLTLRAERGRAGQMNAGAAAARGEILLFLHADTVPPPQAPRLIAAGLAASGRCWGRFDVRIAGSHRLLPLVACMMNLRSRLTGIATGDQGIFATRQCFEAAGGFAALPLMEDIEFSRRMKKRGAPLCLRARVTTSGRRWERHGVLRTIALMWRLRLAYFLGADPATLARRYADPDAGNCGVAVFAKAPQPGRAKTRLIPLLGAGGAAQLQQMLLARALATAHASKTGKVVLWCTPHAEHPLLQQACAHRATQCGGDLGARMHAAAGSMLGRHACVIIIGTDCPALSPADLRTAAAALDANDAVVMPAEDGGFVLLGLRRTDARLFENIEWGGNQVMTATRRNLDALGWRWREMHTAWDVDRPDDFTRLMTSGLMPEIAALKTDRTD